MKCRFEVEVAFEGAEAGWVVTIDEPESGQFCGRNGFQSKEEVLEYIRHSFDVMLDDE